MAKRHLVPIDLYTATSDPTGVSAGEIYFNTSTNKVRQYDGASWSDVASGGSASNSFSTIAVSGQSNVVADSTTDTLTLAASNNLAITTNATTDTVTFGVNGYTLEGVYYFTSSNTNWSIPSGTRYIRIKAVGGGGGGGGAATTTTNQWASGAGGGAGAYVEVYGPVGANTVLYISVGSGGSGGSAGNNNGVTGGNSIVRFTNISGTLLCQANGGSGGVGSAAGTAAFLNSAGAGGAVWTTYASGFVGVSINGSDAASGRWTVGNSASNFFGNAETSGNAASMFYPGQASYITSSSAVGRSANGYGGGGEGGATSEGSTQVGGGAGSAGLVIVECYE